jgi:hypothetical protein
LKAASNSFDATIKEIQQEAINITPIIFAEKDSTKIHMINDAATHATHKNIDEIIRNFNFQ